MTVELYFQAVLMTYIGWCVIYTTWKLFAKVYTAVMNVLRGPYQYKKIDMELKKK